MSYPLTRMARVLESVGCTNAAAGALALAEDQPMVKALLRTLEDLPEPGTPMTAVDRQRWTDRLGQLLDAYRPVTESDAELAGEAVEYTEPEGRK